MIERLENNEAVLVMYLAGELPAEDRAEVEQQLAADAGLRGALDRLREAHDAIAHRLSDGDTAAIPPATEAARRSAAVRRVSRALVKARVEQEETAAAAAAARAVAGVSGRGLRLRFPAWAYPIATAAMILIACVAYWGFTNSPGGSGSTDRAAQARAQTFDRPEDVRAADALRSLDADPTDRQAVVAIVNNDDAGLDLASLVRTVAGRGDASSTEESREE